MNLGACGPLFSECVFRRAARRAGNLWYVPSLNGWISITHQKAVHHDCIWCGGRLPHPPSAHNNGDSDISSFLPGNIIFLAPDVWDEGEG